MTTPIVKITPKSGVVFYVNLSNVAEVICAHNDDGSLHEATVTYNFPSKPLVLEGGEAIALIETLDALAGEAERYTAFYKQTQSAGWLTTTLNKA